MKKMKSPLRNRVRRAPSYSFHWRHFAGLGIRRVIQIKKYNDAMKNNG